MGKGNDPLCGTRGLLKEIEHAGVNNENRRTKRGQNKQGKTIELNRKLN